MSMCIQQCDFTVVSCTDPVIFVMGRVGGPGSTDRKNTLITFSYASAFYNFTEGSNSLF